MILRYILEECRQAPRLNVRCVERNVTPDAHGMLSNISSSIVQLTLLSHPKHLFRRRLKLAL